jgi:Na+/melibiose symporter-like transporter
VRLATLIISLVLTLVVGFQSCAALLGGGMGEEFGETAKEKAEGKELSDASGAGLVAGYIWAVVSLIFMAMAWRGIKERERKEAERQEGQFAQFEQWQQQQGRQPPGSPPPQAGGS